MERLQFKARELLYKNDSEKTKKGGYKFSN